MLCAPSFVLICVRVARRSAPPLPPPARASNVILLAYRKLSVICYLCYVTAFCYRECDVRFYHDALLLCVALFFYLSSYTGRVIDGRDIIIRTKLQ